MPTPSLAEIEKQCRDYDTSCAALAAELAELNADLQAVKVKRLARIKRLAAVVARDEAALQGLIEAAPELFKKPRTAVFHGTKVGFYSSEGSVETDDEKRSIELIKTALPKKAATLINTVEKLKKDAIKKLSAYELDTIECRIEGAGDQVVIKRVDGEIEKLVDKFIEKLCAAVVETDGGQTE